MNCVSDKTDNRREVTKRLYIENDYQSVRNFLYENDYQGHFSQQMSKGLISLVRNARSLQVRSPEIPQEIIAAEYTSFQHITVDMYSEATVVVIPPIKRVHLMNSLAPVIEQKAPFLKKNHVSSNFIHRPSFIVEEENWDKEVGQCAVYDIYVPQF